MAESAASLIEAIAVLRPEPGDIIVLRTPETVKLRADDVARIREQLSHILPEGVQTLIMDGGLTLDILRVP